MKPDRLSIPILASFDNYAAVKGALHSKWKRDNV